MEGALAFDRVLDALAHPIRRQVLVGLIELTPQSVDNSGDASHAIASFGGDVFTGERTRMELFHRHLPKLHDYDYVVVDERSEEISPGANWEEIEPVLRVLRSNEEALPPDWLGHSR